jgi:deoxyxylulose-5-phosphate synthase
VGQRILAGLATRGIALKSARLMNLGDRFIPHGTPEELRRLYEIDAAALYDAAMEDCHG